jgi:hypothetical protein
MAVVGGGVGAAAAGDGRCSMELASSSRDEYRSLRLLRMRDVLVVNGDAHWEPLPPMHDSRDDFACGAVAGCVIVAGGSGRKSAELYDEELNRWLRLPCDLPYVGRLSDMGSAVL